MVDARGHGLSDAPDSGYSDSNHAADLAGLIAALELGCPALMGHSMGASTVAATAAQYPDLVSCAILEDPPWRARPPSPADISRGDDMRKNMFAQKSMTSQELRDWCLEKRPAWDTIELDAWVATKQQFSLHVAEYLGRPCNWKNTVDGVRCSALLVSGDTSAGAIVDQKTSREACSRNSLFEAVTIDGAGHNIRRERFEQYMKAVKEFLDRHKT